MSFKCRVAVSHAANHVMKCRYDILREIYTEKDCLQKAKLYQQGYTYLNKLSGRLYD